MIKLDEVIDNYNFKILKKEEEIKNLKNERDEVIKIKKRLGNEVDEYIYKSTLEPVVKNVKNVNKLKR